jgi:predicted metal-dependent peptidase
MTDNLPARLQQARLTLLLDFPFFGQLALRLRPVIDPAVETAQTDGREIRFNPDYCAKLSNPQLTWLYAHEVAHPALGHNWRIGNRNLDKVNRAADYVVNEMLAQVIATQSGACHRMQQVPRALRDAQYDGLSMEQIYSILPDEEEQPGQAPRPAPAGAFTKPGPDPTLTQGSGDPGDAPPQPSDALEQEWKAAAAEAATVTRTRNKGHLPGAIAELLKELFEPAVPWQDVLRQFISRVVRDDYTFKRPNRRFAHQGVILPTLRSEGLGVIAVGVDTSGSIKCDDTLLTTFLSELQGILDTTAPEKLHILDCDARVHSHNEFVPGDDLRGTTFHGGGGTSFRPVFTWLEEHDVTPDVLIYLTDLEGSFPATAPAYPTLWLNYGSPRTKAPFGETIHIPKTNP